MALFNNAKSLMMGVIKIKKIKLPFKIKQNSFNNIPFEIPHHIRTRIIIDSMKKENEDFQDKFICNESNIR